MKVNIKRLLIMVFLFPASLFAEPVTTIINSGDSKNRVDVVVLGDGYSAVDIASGKYASDVKSMIDGMFLQEPFLEYKNFFNVHRIDVTSVDSGISSTNPIVNKNTALGTYFGCSSYGIICMKDARVVNTVISNSVQSNQKDIIIVLLNERRSAGTTYGNIALLTNSFGMANTALHEVGHSFGLLADEYESANGNTCNSKIEPFDANVTIETNRNLIKWNTGGGPPTGWIEPSTPIPTTGINNNIIGLFNGAKYCINGIYRPSFDSKMRTSSSPFNSIAIEELILSIYFYVSPIDTGFPNTLFRQINSNQTQYFDVKTPIIANGNRDFDINWILDGQIIGTGSNYALTNSGQLTIGNHKLEVLVKDNNSKIRTDFIGKNEARRIWNLNIEKNGIISPVNGVILPGSSVKFDWVVPSDALKDSGYISIGSSLDGTEYYGANIRSNSTGVTVNNIPTDGRKIYVSMWYTVSFDNGDWRMVSDFTYTAFQ